MKSKAASQRANGNGIAKVSERVLIAGGPPISLTAFVAQMGINVVTAWRWRKDGILKTVNIYGRAYVRPEDVAEFNRRAMAGEFARNTKTPRKVRK